MLCITCNIPHVNSKHPHDCDLKLSVQVNPPSLVKVFSSFFQLAEIRIVAVKDSRPCFVYLRTLTQTFASGSPTRKMISLIEKSYQPCLFLEDILHAPYVAMGGLMLWLASI